MSSIANIHDARGKGQTNMEQRRRVGFGLSVRRTIMTGAFLFLILSSAPCRGEVYLGGAIGGNFPLDLSDVEFTGLGLNISSSDIQLEDSLSYGAKVGYFFPSLKWLGIEAEAYNSNPNIPQQTISVMGIPVNLEDTDLRVTTAAFNFVARYPGSRFEPYLGIGPGVFWAELSNRGESVTAVIPGLNVIAGTRFFLTKWLAFYTEYKFNYAKFDFETDNVTFRGTYRANHIHGGISLHFK